MVYLLLMLDVINCLPAPEKEKNLDCDKKRRRVHAAFFFQNFLFRFIGSIFAHAHARNRTGGVARLR